MEWTPASIALLTTSATLAVTIVLFILEWRRHVKESHLETRRRAISRVIDAVEAASRATSTPFHPRAGGELELALAVPRLLLEIEPKQRAVANWTIRKIQLMRLAPTDVTANGIALEIGSRLIQWHHGELRLDWFEEEVRRDPPVSPFRVPARARAARAVNRSWTSSKLGFLIGVGVAPLPLIARQILHAWRDA